MKNTIFIIGLGLIGGSLALGLKRNEHNTIIGFDTNSRSLVTAKKLGIIDEEAATITDKIETADFVIFATPVTETIRLMNELPLNRLKQNVILTDTGSTKKEIMRAAKTLTQHGITFIGGHPMAGSHKSGVEAAKAHLFENAYYVLTTFENEHPQHVQRLKELLAVTKAKVIEINAEEHDHMTAVVSHFPHLIAASLVHQLSSENNDFPFTRQLAAGGFRDITRIASSNPIMWRDITLQNREELQGQLNAWMNEMSLLHQLLEKGSNTDIETYFERAKKFRDDLPITTQGAFYTAYDLYIDIPDYPGIISEITGYLAEENISITNLRILETREDVYGILVISFQTAEDRERAVTCIATHTTYETYIS